MNSITQNQYLDCLHCHRRFWHGVHQPAALHSPVASLGRSERRKTLNGYAARLFPGKDVRDAGLFFCETMVRHGQADDPLVPAVPVVNVLVYHEDLAAQLDLLNPAEAGRWDLFEVERAEGERQEQIAGLAFQKYVAQRAGLGIGRCHLVLVGRADGSRGAAGPGEEPLSTLDVTREVDFHLPLVEQNLSVARAVRALMLSPSGTRGEHCHRPSPCPMNTVCGASPARGEEELSLNKAERGGRG